MSPVSRAIADEAPERPEVKHPFSERKPSVLSILFVADCQVTSIYGCHKV